MNYFQVQNTAMPNYVETIWTAGYGSRTLDNFVQLLTEFHIEAVVDIRPYPGPFQGSKFSAEALKPVLKRREVQFYQLGHQLGSRYKNPVNSVHIALKKPLQGFAEHMATNVFKQGVEHLLLLAERYRTVLVTEKINYENCHRKLVADYLFLGEGIKLVHIVDSNIAIEHTLSSSIRYEYDAIIYDGLKPKSLVVH